MFILAPTEVFKAKVTVNVAMQSGGWREESSTGIFKRTFEEDRKRLMELPNVDLVREVMVGWEMVDEQRAPVEFNDQNLQAFLRLSGAVREATVTYWQHNAGAKAKN